MRRSTWEIKMFVALDARLLGRDAFLRWIVVAATSSGAAAALAVARAAAAA
ncbi:hypothetical protein HC891_04415 [Candidatus Gracilibacteria bacterium]|nr:hypothetical protein [Candidatus Gracilibacteria bacterium]